MKGLKDIIATVAPALATALGGPLAGVAVGELSKALLDRQDGTADEVAAAIATGGTDALVKIKAADQAFAVRMRELDVDLDKARMATDTSDRADARAREQRTGDSWTPRLIALAVVIGWLWVQNFLLHYVVPPDNRELVLGALRTLDAALMFVLGYYFGGMNAAAAQRTAPDSRR